jgi:hypothetical protein
LGNWFGESRSTKRPTLILNFFPVRATAYKVLRPRRKNSLWGWFTNLIEHQAPTIETWHLDMDTRGCAYIPRKHRGSRPHASRPNRCFEPQARAADGKATGLIPWPSWRVRITSSAAKSPQRGSASPTELHCGRDVLSANRTGQSRRSACEDRAQPPHLVRHSRSSTKHDDGRQTGLIMGAAHLGLPART